VPSSSSSRLSIYVCACACDLPPLLAPALIQYNKTAQGADPNAQSMEGMTPYGYVRKRLASPPSGGATNGSGNGTGGSNANNSGDSLAMSRMLQRTSEVLLELGAYKMERSALAIEQDSVTAQWMKVCSRSGEVVVVEQFRGKKEDSSSNIVLHFISNSISFIIVHVVNLFPQLFFLLHSFFFL